MAAFRLTSALQGISANIFSSYLNTNPEIMLLKATSVQEKIRQMQMAFQELEVTINKTKQYWLGEAGDAHREYYNEKKEVVREIFARLSEDVTDLREMAMVYSGAEAEAKEISGDLPSDVIV